MRRGPWHQLGHNSQNMACEQLQLGVGEGVVISPRDLNLENAIRRSQQYREAGADVLLDQQFYVPDFAHDNLKSYPTNTFRKSVSKLHQIPNQELHRLAPAIEKTCRKLATSAIVAPAVVYDAGRDELVNLNHRLFAVAKSVGNVLGIPTYATVVLGRSSLDSDGTVSAIINQATSLDADGWYFGAEFGDDRLPADLSPVFRFCKAALRLAMTGRPVFHAYAGPMGLLSLGFGATAVGVGHSQNLWQFTRERWQPSQSRGGGGGDAPPRFFSTQLWGTLIYPDEIVRLPQSLREAILTHSAFSEGLAAVPPPKWSRWDASKHLVNRICETISTIATAENPKENANAAIKVLHNATVLYRQIRDCVSLADGSDSYQCSWCTALQRLLLDCSDDFEFIDLMKEESCENEG